MVHDGLSLVPPPKLSRKKPNAFLPEPSNRSHESDGKKNCRRHLAGAEKRKSVEKNVLPTVVEGNGTKRLLPIPWLRARAEQIDQGNHSIALVRPVEESLKKLLGSGHLGVVANFTLGDDPVKHKDGRGGPATHSSEKRAELSENINQSLVHAGQPQNRLRPVPRHPDGGFFQARRRVGCCRQRNWTRFRLIGRSRVTRLTPAEHFQETAAEFQPGACSQRDMNRHENARGHKEMPPAVPDGQHGGESQHQRHVYDNRCQQSFPKDEGLNRSQSTCNQPSHKSRRDKLGKAECITMLADQSEASAPVANELREEFAQACPRLVINRHLGAEKRPQATFPYAEIEFNIFAGIKRLIVSSDAPENRPAVGGAGARGIDKPLAIRGINCGTLPVPEGRRPDMSDDLLERGIARHREGLGPCQSIGAGLFKQPRGVRQ